MMTRSGIDSISYARRGRPHPVPGLFRARPGPDFAATHSVPEVRIGPHSVLEMRVEPHSVLVLSARHGRKGDDSAS